MIIREVMMLTQLKQNRLFRTSAYINGCWVDSAETFQVLNPATGEWLADVPQMGATEAENAVAAALNALDEWKKHSAKERSIILRRWFDLIVANADDLALILTLEQGKPLAEAKGEILYGAAYIEWFAEEAKRIYGDIIPAQNSSQQILVTKQPIGVCTAITPWNFPNAMITRKAAPALAAGCTFVIRPASQTPLSALALAELAEQAGIPAGVFNVITGKDVEIGKVFTEDPRVKKFSFTGSTRVGKLLMQQSASTVKKVSLELGSNAPFIVFDDADLDAAVQGAMLSKFRNAGQTCVCANRIYVQSGVYTQFVEKLQQAMNQLKIGNGLESNVDIGPLIDQSAVEKVQFYLQDARQQGGEVIYHHQHNQQKGLFLAPTIITNANQKMKLAKEEIFGPVAPIFRFDSEQEVIALANDTEFGLASYFYSRDVGRIMRVSQALEYGIVGVNSGLISNEMAPFGGVKQSGLGREGSKYGIEDYLEIKYTLLAGLDK